MSGRRLAYVLLFIRHCCLCETLGKIILPESLSKHEFKIWLACSHTIISLLILKVCSLRCRNSPAVFQIFFSSVISCWARWLTSTLGVHVWKVILILFWKFLLIHKKYVSFNQNQKQWELFCDIRFLANAVRESRKKHSPPSASTACTYTDQHEWTSSCNRSSSVSFLKMLLPLGSLCSPVSFDLILCQGWRCSLEYCRIDTAVSKLCCYCKAYRWSSLGAPQKLLKDNFTTDLAGITFDAMRWRRLYDSIQGAPGHSLFNPKWLLTNSNYFLV